MRQTYLGAIFFLLLTFAAQAGDTWPQFRGPTQQGHSYATGLAVTWAEGGKSIVYKTPIPGEGWSSPVVPPKTRLRQTWPAALLLRALPRARAKRARTCNAANRVNAGHAV